MSSFDQVPPHLPPLSPHLSVAPTGPTKRRLKRIAPLQLAKMSALMYGAMGLIFIPVFLLMAAVGAAAPDTAQVGFFAMGIGFAIFAPIMYAVMGFVVGIVGAALYNLMARWIGGIEVEVE